MKRMKTTLLLAYNTQPISCLVWMMVTLPVALHKASLMARLPSEAMNGHVQVGSDEMALQQEASK